VAFFQRIAQFFRRLLALEGGEFLCDRCKYNHPNTCSKRERPNARVCRDFKGK
jgi:hypothetical protein